MRSDELPPPAHIDLVELLLVLWQRKWFIVGTTVLFAIAGILYALFATPTYRAEVVLAPTQRNATPSIPAGFSSLAGLAGINLGSSNNTVQAVATLRSRAFVEEFIRDNTLLPVLFADRWSKEDNAWNSDHSEDPPDIQDGVKYFIDNVRTVEEDAEAGTVTFAIEWSDPNLAAEWAEELVIRINERLRTRDLADSQARLEYLHRQLKSADLVELRQAISRLIQNQIETIMLAQAESEYAFKVIDPARVPNERVSPRRVLIVILATFVGGLLGSAGALFHWAVLVPLVQLNAGGKQ